MSDYGIKPEWAQAWAFLDSTREPDSHDEGDKVADLALHLLAALMEAEFKREHTHCRAKQIVMLNPDRTFIEWYSGNESCHDPRHTYDHDAWLEAARKVMEEMGK